MSVKKLTQRPSDILLNSTTDTDYMLGNPPKWIIKWGMSLIFLVVILFIGMAWLIKYPDIIQAKVTVLTENPAIRIVAFKSGKVKELLVKNHQAVKQGSLLAVLDSPVNKEDVLILEAYLAELEGKKHPEEYVRIAFPQNVKLGELQKPYASLVQRIEDFHHFLDQPGYYDKIDALKQQIEHGLKLNKSLKKQQQTFAKEVQIAEVDFIRYSKLKEAGVISNQELEQKETAYLQYQRQLDNFEGQIVNNQLQIEQLKTQIIDIRQSYGDGLNTKALKIREDIKLLKSQIESWKQIHLIKSPIEGRINYAKVWSANQFIPSGEELFTVIPSKGAGKVVAKALLPIENSGKVKSGQQVNLRLDGFPYQEFGMVRSEVVRIALIPEEETYTAELALPNPLITTYGKTIPFSQEMQGIGRVITEDRRIIHRIFEKVWSLINDK